MPVAAAALDKVVEPAEMVVLVAAERASRLRMAILALSIQVAVAAVADKQRLPVSSTKQAAQAAPAS
jgi:hypothetical protein